LKTKILFRLLAILTMGVVFLPIVFANLPSPLNRPYTYMVSSCLLIFVFHTKVFFNKNLLPLYLFILVYSISIPLFWSNVTIGAGDYLNISWLLKEIGWTFLAILLSTYFINVKDYYGFGLVSLVALTFIIITSITSIVGFSVFPYATRQMANGEAINAGMKVVFRKMGFGSYGFFSGLAFLFPVLSYYLKRSELNLKIKLLFFIFISLSFYAIFKASLTTSMLTALMFFILALTTRGYKIKNPIIITFIGFFLVFIVFKHQVANQLFNLADTFEGTDYGFKLCELGKAIETGDLSPKSGQNYIAKERMSRSYFSIMSFFENPIIGGGKSMGHAHWLDRLGLFGLIGFLPWVLIFRSQIKQNVKIFSDNYKLFYYLSFVSFIVFGLIKGGLESVEISVSIFFLAPGVYFLKYLITTSQKVKNAHK